MNQEICMIRIEIAVPMHMTPLTHNKYHVGNYMIIYTKKSPDGYVLLTHRHIEAIINMNGYSSGNHPILCIE